MGEISNTRPAEFDAARLDAYLRDLLPDIGGTMALERISGGQSNPTFFVTYETRRMVLRKQPAGSLLPSAHAVDREFRIMTALAGTGVPVPVTLAYCADESVLGTPFYVMDRVDGRVFADCSLPGVSPVHRRAMFLDMADTLAKLHTVDWAAAGLSDYGKQGDYFRRQVTRWTHQWELSKTRALPDVDRLVKWLPSHLPDDTATAISHGDFRVGNLMFHPNEPRVVAVLDWELSTLGHPLADLAYSALAWHLKSTEYMGMKDRVKRWASPTSRTTWPATTRRLRRRGGCSRFTTRSPCSGLPSSSRASPPGREAAQPHRRMRRRPAS